MRCIATHSPNRDTMTTLEGNTRTTTVEGWFPDGNNRRNNMSTRKGTGRQGAGSNSKTTGSKTPSGKAPVKASLAKTLPPEVHRAKSSTSNVTVRYAATEKEELQKYAKAAGYANLSDYCIAFFELRRKLTPEQMRNVLFYGCHDPHVSPPSKRKR